MEFVKSVDSDYLDEWLIKNNASYLQSSLWQRILLSTGQEVERVEARGDGEIVASALLVYRKLPFGWRYAWCPKGLVIATASPVIPAQAGIQALATGSRIPVRDDSIRAYEALINYLRKQNCIFLRCEPAELLVGLPLKLAREINPSATLVLDIQKNTEKIFAEMHTKTRYNIRVAERKGLKISCEKDFSIFWELLKKTGERDRFTLHPQENYKKVMADDSVRQITIFTPEGKAIASGGFVGFGDRYYYLYGALDYEERQLMAPYLLQWTAIQQGKKLGYKYYDFFGIAPGEMKGGEYVYDSKHLYAGITRFKLGFVGVPENAPGTFDLIVDKKKYLLYKLLSEVKKIASIV